MSKESRERKFDGKPYHIAKTKDVLVWAYNEGRTFHVYVSKDGIPGVYRFRVRKSVLRNLVALS